MASLRDPKHEHQQKQGYPCPWQLCDISNNVLIMTWWLPLPSQPRSSSMHACPPAQLIKEARTSCPPRCPRTWWLLLLRPSMPPPWWKSMLTEGTCKEGTRIKRKEVSLAMLAASDLRSFWRLPSHTC